MQCVCVFVCVCRGALSHPLTTQRVRCGAVPPPMACVRPQALLLLLLLLHAVVLQRAPPPPSPPHPLLQAPQPPLGSADEVWPQQLQSLLEETGEERGRMGVSESVGEHLFSRC